MVHGSSPWRSRNREIHSFSRKKHLNTLNAGWKRESLSQIGKIWDRLPSESSNSSEPQKKVLRETEWCWERVLQTTSTTSRETRRQAGTADDRTRQEISRENRMKPAYAIGLVEIPKTDCAASGKADIIYCQYDGGWNAWNCLTSIPWESQNIPLEPQPEFKNIRFWHFYKKKELMIWNVTKVTNGRKHKRLWLNWQSTGLLIQVVRVRVPLDAVMPLGVAVAQQPLKLWALVRIQ